MTAKKLSDADCIEVVNTFKKSEGNVTEAAKLLNLNRATFRHRFSEARRRGFYVHEEVVDNNLGLLKDRVRTLESLLRNQQKIDLDAEKVRTEILKLTAQTPEPPSWLISSKRSKQSPGVPSLFISDLHWGEVVDPSQIGGVNEYNLEIAQRRLRECVTRTIYLLKQHVVNPDFPGIVMILGGDMVTGDIHEELTATNEREIMPTFVDLFGVLAWAISTMADQFGRVFVPCVTGNHGRNTHKIRAKGRNFTSYDWLLYVMLEKHFAADKRVSFYIPNGPDALFKIFGTRYLLTHGDQFRGGDGMIGALGPILRGDHKKRSRNSQVGHEYDILLMGHWHQLIQLRKLIVNGSLKGYDEYGNANNFSFEPPAQALWITHPTHGVTISMPVYVDSAKQQESSQWVSWKSA